MKSILRYKELLLTMAGMDLKLKYQNSKIGMLWSLLKPLLQFVAYYTVFGIILKVSDDPDYALRLFLGILLWSFFMEATGNGLMCYIGKKTIITKVRVEKKIIPIASFLTALFNFALTMVVFVPVYLIFVLRGLASFHWERLWVLPVFLVSYSVFIISVNIILATLNVLFRDLQTIWDLVLMYGVFLTPIMYTLPIPEKFLNVYYFINPLAFPIEEIRSVFFGTGGVWQRPDHALCYFAAVAMWLGLAILVDKKFKAKVADYL